MKPCTHIHIDGANIMIKHKGLGAQFCESYFPLQFLMAVFICIFFNILKPLSGNFMKPCTHIHIDGANIMIKHKGLGASSVRVISLCNS